MPHVTGKNALPFVRLSVPAALQYDAVSTIMQLILLQNALGNFAAHGVTDGWHVLQALQLIQQAAGHKLCLRYAELTIFFLLSTSRKRRQQPMHSLSAQTARVL